MRLLRSVGIIAFTSLAIAACGSDADERSSAGRAGAVGALDVSTPATLESTSTSHVARIDSAGIAITQVAWQAALEAADTIRLTEPLLRIGSAAGDASYEFDRITTIAPLGDLGFAVGDASASIRHFDWKGTLVRTFGGKGQGPGELTAASSAFRYRGDSLAVYDVRQGRITVFPLSGTGEPRSIRIENGTPNGAYADGRFLFTRGISGTPEGASRDRYALMTRTASGEMMDTVGVFPGGEAIRRSVPGQFTFNLAAPYPLTTSHQITTDGFVVADGATPGFEIWSSRGRRLAIWRSDEPRRALDPRLVAAQKDSTISNLPVDGRAPAEMRAAMIQAVNSAPYPDSLPYSNGIETDGSGRVWLRRDQPSDATPVYAWIEPDGRLAHIVIMAKGVQLRRITTTHAFAIATDALGIQRVEVYKLP